MKTNGKRIAFAAVVSVVGFEGVTAGQTINEDLKITGPVSEPFRFGQSVAVSGSVAIISDPNGSAGPNRMGAAHAFDVNTGELLFELTPTLADDEFVDIGRSVAIKGNVAVVGGISSLIKGPTLGAAYVFDVSTGEQLFVLKDPAPGSFGESTGFGVSVAVNDDTIVVGSPSDFAFPSSAEVHVYDLSSGELLETVTPKDLDSFGSRFGSTVAISETRFAVDTLDQWQVDVFDLNSGDRMYAATPPPLTEATGYGNALGISESHLVIGAWGDPSIEGQLGSAFVYDSASGEYLYKITPPLEDEAFQFGWSVAVEGSIAVIGAFFDEPEFFEDPKDQKRGTAYVYDLNSGELLLKFRPTDSELSDDFGRAVATDGQTVVVGRPKDDEAGTNEGAAYIFTLPPFDCPGDTTGDDTVDLADLNLVLANFGSTTSDGDATGDGQVDLADLNLVLGNFGAICG